MHSNNTLPIQHNRGLLVLQKTSSYNNKPHELAFDDTHTSFPNTVSQPTDRISQLPIEILEIILDFAQVDDKLQMSRVSKTFKTLAYGDRQWGPFLKKSWENFKTGKRILAKDIFGQNLFAIHPNYLNLHPKAKLIINHLNNLINEKKEAQVFSEYACSKMENAVIFLSDKEFYKNILKSRLAPHYLFRIACSHVEAALMILQNEKLYNKFLDSTVTSSHLFKIAQSHSAAALMILQNEKLYKKFLNSTAASSYLFEIAKSHSVAALTILKNKIFYTEILASTKASDHLSDMACSYVDAALIILQNEKFYSKILESTDASDYLCKIAQSHLNTKEYRNRETLLEALHQRN